MNNLDYRGTKKSQARSWSRRRFLQVVAAAILAGCAPKLTPQPTAEPTTAEPNPAPPSATPTTQIPTQTFSDRPTPAPSPWSPCPPRAPTRQHSGAPVIAAHGAATAPTRHPPDAQCSITPTGLTRAAWRTSRRACVGISEHHWGSAYWTHAPLAMALLKAQEAGLPRNRSSFLTGRPASCGRDTIGTKMAPGRCCGTDGAYTGGWTLDDGIALSDVLLSCDALSISRAQNAQYQWHQLSR